MFSENIVHTTPLNVRKILFANKLLAIFLEKLFSFLHKNLHFFLNVVPRNIIFLSLTMQLERYFLWVLLKAQCEPTFIIVIFM